MPKKRLPAIVNISVWEKVTKGRAGLRWDSVVEKVWKDIGGNQKGDVRREVWGVQGRSSRRNDKKNGNASATKQGGIGKKHLGIYGGLSEGIGMKTYLHGPMDFAKTLKLRFRVGDQDLPERRKRYTSSRGEEEMDAHMCPCGKAIESRTHTAGECQIYIQGGTECVTRVGEGNRRM